MGVLNVHIQCQANIWIRCFRSSGPVSYGFASLENSVMLETETICSPNGSDSGSGPPSLQNEFENLGSGDKMPSPEEASPVKPKPTGHSTTKKEQRSGNTLYQELSFQDNEESEENEVTGEFELPTDWYPAGAVWPRSVNVPCGVLAALMINRSQQLDLNNFGVILFLGSWVHPGDYASSGKCVLNSSDCGWRGNSNTNSS